MPKKPSYLYIMRLTWGRVKIGYSNSPKLRKGQVNKDVRVKRIIRTFKCKNRYKAEHLEKWVHAKLDRLRWWGKHERFYLPLFSWWIVVPLVVWWRLFIGWWK